MISKSLTHKTYFCRYRLNPEQYGEILLAELLSGLKMGDAQRGYDIHVESARFSEFLQSSRASDSMHASVDGDVRLEVKTKISKSAGSVATVVHCSKSKLSDKLIADGSVIPTSMTHLAVVFVDPGSRGLLTSHGSEGDIASAYLLTKALAKQLLRVTKSSSYISVSSIRQSLGSPDILDITDRLEDQANKALCDHQLNHQTLITPRA